MKKIALLLTCLLLITSCTVSYSFKGAMLSDDYKTIEIQEFKNQAALVYPPLEQVFNDYLKNTYIRNTKLQISNVNPDLVLEGEISQYDLTPLAVGQNALATQTRLTMGVRIRFKDNKDPRKDKEQTFTAYADFDTSQTLTAVQDQLIDQLTKEIVDQIFNATMMDW